jgi:hypothetical protein
VCHFLPRIVSAACVCGAAEEAEKADEKNQESARALAATFPDSIFMIAEGRV